MFVPRVQEAGLPVLALPLPEVSDVIKNIAVKCLKDFAASLACGVIVSLFVVAAPSGLAFTLGATLIQLAVSAFFHSVGAFVSYKAQQGNEYQIHYERIASICEWITGINFAFFTGYNTQTLIHESGHALATLLVYKNPRPMIELYPIVIYPLVGGANQFYKTGLSGFGKTIGPAAATCLVFASGPGLTLLLSSVLLAVGIAMKEKYPAFSKYLITWSVLDFVVHATYAYSAVSANQWNLSHDFVHLSIFGLNPVAAAIGLIVIPIVITLGTLWWKSNGKPPGEVPGGT